MYTIGFVIQKDENWKTPIFSVPFIIRYFNHVVLHTLLEYFQALTNNTFYKKS